MADIDWVEKLDSRPIYDFSGVWVSGPENMSLSILTALTYQMLRIKSAWWN